MVQRRPVMASAVMTKAASAVISSMLATVKEN
jgi:hypothetical protein